MLVRARLGRTLRQWREQILAYFATGGVNNGGAEAIKDVIQKTRRLAHGFRNFDNYRLRILLAADGTRRYRELDSEEQPAVGCDWSGAWSRAVLASKAVRCVAFASGTSADREIVQRGSADHETERVTLRVVVDPPRDRCAVGRRTRRAVLSHEHTASRHDPLVRGFQVIDQDVEVHQVRPA